MNLKTSRGIKLAVLTALFSGIANFVNKSAVIQTGDALLFTALKNSLAGVVVITSLVFLRKLELIKKLDKKDKINLLMIGIIGGALPFYLFFSALTQIPALNAALIHKTLVFWTAIMATVFLGEKVKLMQFAAIGLIYSANLITGSFKGFSYSGPELWVLLATLFWSVENVISKKTLRKVDPDLVIAARMGIGSLILLSAVLISGKADQLLTIDINQYLVISGVAVLLYGYMATWYRALQYIPLTLAATILTGATLVTNFLSLMQNGNLNPDIVQQTALIGIGILLYLGSCKRSAAEKISF